MAKSRNDLIIGILLVALGVLIALGKLSLGWLVLVAGVAAVVLGIFLLTQRRRESPTVAIILVVLGGLVILSDNVLAAFALFLNVAVGVALIIGGILKVESKW